jgi:hypothetical protein
MVARARKSRSLARARPCLLWAWYASHRAPHDPLPALHAAMINDPDGNTILLSAEERRAAETPAAEQAIDP